MAVRHVSGLMELAGDYRDKGGQAPMPVLFLVGPAERAVTPDGTVLERIGVVDGQPAYKLVPRMYKITDCGGVVVQDDHPDWLGPSEEPLNDEQATIPGDDLTLVVVAEPANDEFQPPEGATNVLRY